MVPANAAVTGGGTYDEVTARAPLRAEIPAGELLAPVYAGFTEGFNTADLKNAKALLDALA